jgi:ATPase subunit of ABC transporter with duplicated ATPase domains
MRFHDKTLHREICRISQSRVMILFRLADLSRDEVLTVMATVGFTDDGKAKPHHAVSTLSGGWRMKLAMARAMLQRADILLLDEVSLILMNNSFANYSYVVAF